MKKFINLLFGIIILAIGTAICHYTGLGIDPFNALCSALSINFKISLGTMTLCIQTLIAIIILFTYKEYLGIGSVVPMLLFGYLLQFFHLFFSSFPSLNSLILKFFIFAIGMLMITLGMSLYMNTKLGMVPYDGISFAFSKIFHKNAFYIRVFLDVSVSLLAYFMHGPIAVGTIVLALGIGPLLKVFDSYII